jgi:hypothetical protein
LYDFGDDTGMRGLAKKLGLTYVGNATNQTYLEEVGGLPDLPILGFVEPESVTDLQFGRYSGANVELFNVELPAYAPDPRFPRRSCVVMTFVADFPTVVLAPQTPMAKLRNAKLFRSFSPEFKDKFEVQTKAPEDAEIVFGPELTQWLVDQRDDLRFEIAGGALIGHIPQVDEDGFLELLDLVQVFHALIPDEAWGRFSLFGNLSL